MYSPSLRIRDREVLEELLVLSSSLGELQPVVKYQAVAEVTPLSPDSKQTVVFFSGLTGNLTLDLTDGRAGDRLVLVNEHASYTITLGTGNSKLSGGTSWVGGQYDTITLIFSELSGFWLELARSSNS